MGVILDDRWDDLYELADERRAAVYRATTDASSRQQADAEWDAVQTRISDLERETLAREAAGEPEIEWHDLVAAVFGEQTGSDQPAEIASGQPSA